MGRRFAIPSSYRSGLISQIKNSRRDDDQRKRDLSPSLLTVGKLTFKIARHFGFCFGVQNAIEIAYRAIEENPGRKIFLLSEMIHNPQVNEDLMNRGVRFLLAPDGTELFPFDQLTPKDVVIIPAFGTTVELFARLAAIGVSTAEYNTTCPFVEKVWKRAGQLGRQGFTIVIHGKHTHEETRATFSHAVQNTPGVVIRDIDEARRLKSYILGEGARAAFFSEFSGRHSPEFDPERDLRRIGVVNQTTMLATETQAISDLLRETMAIRYGKESLHEHFADTRDTLCYATSENQDAVYALLAAGGDLAIVVGGYNSSNTSHLVEILEHRIPTFYIKDASEIVDAGTVRHLDLEKRAVIETVNWLPFQKEKVEVLITAGASCPDAVVDEVLQRVAECFGESLSRPETPVSPEHLLDQTVT